MFRDWAARTGSTRVGDTPLRAAPPANNVREHRPRIALQRLDDSQQFKHVYPPLALETNDCGYVLRPAPRDDMIAGGFHGHDTVGAAVRWPLLFGVASQTPAFDDRSPFP
jgi:hypothetical protein